MKKVLSYILALTLLLSVFPICIFTASADTSGYFTYSITNGTATVTKYNGVGGFVTIPDALGGYPVATIGDKSFKDVLGLYSITFPETVTTIGVEAFKGCTGLTDLVFPDKVATINNNAFNGCTGLTRVVIGSGVNKIDYSAFDGCTGLTTMTIPDNVTSLGTTVFQGCTGLTTVTIGNGITTLGANLFSGCTGLSTVNIGSKVSKIDFTSFAGCTGLGEIIISEDNVTFSSQDCVLFNKSKSILVQYLLGKTQSYIIPNCVTGIGEKAFSGCTQLTGVTIPISVTDIGKNAFYGCVRLTGIVIPDSVTNIKSDTFSGCTALKSVNIPGSVIAIEKGAFYGCSVLNNVTLGTGVQVIGDAVFQNCISLTQITLPDSLNSIGVSAFSGCTGLLEVTIPDNVSSIGNSAFSGCTGLTKAIIGCTVSSIGESAFNGCTSLMRIDLPDSVLSVGKSVFQGCTKLTNATIGDGLKAIPELVFKGCTSLTSFSIGTAFDLIYFSAFNGCTSLVEFNVDENNMGFSSRDCVLFNKNKTEIVHYFYGPSSSYVIPNSVTTIDMEAFFYCTQLTGITIPNSVSDIAGRAFIGCTGLTSVTIPNSVTYLSDSVFSECRGLSSVSLPSTLETIGNDTFSGCSGLLSLTIPEKVISVGNNSFKNCNKIQRLTLPSSLKIIGSYAFNNCYTLTTLTIPSGVRTIGTYAFSGCSGLLDVTIADSVTAIGSYAFSSCSKMNKVTISSGITTIAEGTFSGCKALTNVAIPYGVSNIGNSAFNGCSILYDVDIANTVTSIGDKAFFGCSVLPIIIIPNSVSTIGAGAFQGCSNLRRTFIGHEVTKIGSDAFRSCVNLSYIVIPVNVSNIGANAFNSCSILQNAYFFGDAPIMGADVFKSCAGGFRVNYLVGKSGFSNPWYGFVTQTFSPLTDIVFKVTPTATTCGNVSVTIYYPIDAVETKYKIGDGAWIDYTTPVTVVSNGDVFAMCTDIDGNTSCTGSIHISNIDKAAPDAPTLTVNETNLPCLSVAVTITYPSDSAVKQYRLDSGEWINYSLPVILVSNGKVEARCADEAGNISAISVLSVGNIDTQAPIVTGVTNDSNYIGGRTITIDSGTATLDGNPFTSGSTVSSKGTHTLIVTDEVGNKTTVIFTIVVRVSSITLSISKASWLIGKTGQIIATVKPTDADNTAVNWSSNNTSVIKIDSSGNASAVGIGDAIITCSAKDGSGVKATCTITVIPQKPTSPKAASASYNSIKISWSAVSGATGYAVYRSKSSANSFSRLATIASVCYTDTSLDTGTTYYYKIYAYKTVNGSNKYSAASDTVSAVPTLGVPVPKAASASYNSIKISWPAVSGATGYVVYRYYPSTQAYKKIKTTTAASYTDTSLTTGTTYQYRVKAYRTVNKISVFSATSALASAYPKPATPGSFTAARASSSSIKLSWKAVTGATGYEVYRATFSTGTYSLVKTTSSLSYTNTGLTKNKTYYYKVRAYTKVGDKKIYGAYTTVKSAKPY